MSLGRAPDVRGFVLLLRAEPALMPCAPAGEACHLIDHRTLGEVHSCLRCGQRAQVAYIGNLDGPRWLDLCASCDHWFRCGLDAMEREDGAELAGIAGRLGEAWKP